MCYAKPGPRCSAHAKKRLFAAKLDTTIAINEYQKLRETPDVDTDLLRKSEIARYRAGEREGKAIEEYDETPAGQKELIALGNLMLGRSDVYAAAGVYTRRSEAMARRNKKLSDLKKQQEEQKLAKEASNKTAKEVESHLSAAQAAETRVQESWDRSDTDGFLSQFAGSMTARLERSKADLAANGGRAEFAALFDLDGNLVPAKNVHTQYGWTWMLLSDPNDPHSSAAGWIAESKASTSEKQRLAMERKGYRIGKVLVPAGAKLDSPPGARGLSGMTSVYVTVYRKDGGFSKDVEITNNGKEPLS